MSNHLNLIFAGTPEFGLPCLNALFTSRHALKAVYTQPDRPAGRGRHLQASAIKQWAVSKHIPVYQPINFKSDTACEELAALQPDLMIVIAYGLILPKRVLDIPRLGCVNVHASLLPRWRGASPIQQAILAGDTESGVTVMKMDEGMDTGAMLQKITCSINATDTAGSLHDKLACLSVEPLLQMIDLLAQQRAPLTHQPEHGVTYAKKINKSDACIDWHISAEKIDRQIRAFNPWPIAYTKLGEDSLRVYQARAVADSVHHCPGTILSIDKQGILVATGEGSLLLEKIQFPGSKAMTVADWLNAGKAEQYIGLILQ